MGITDFEFKARGLLEEKMMKYRNSIPRKAVVELIEKVCQAYNNLQEEKFNPPIKVGDLLYYIYRENVKSEWVIDDDPKQVNEIGTKYFFISTGLIDHEEPDDYYTYDEIGKKFFLTREEAEAAVAKLREEQNHGEE